MLLIKMKLAKAQEWIETVLWDEVIEHDPDWLKCFCISVCIIAVGYFGGLVIWGVM